MTDKDLTALLEGSVSDITAQFGALTDAHLVKAHDAEMAKDEPKRRTTLISAIAAEQQARALTADAEKLQAEAAAKGVTLYTQAQLDATVADLNDRIVALEKKATVKPASPKATSTGKVRKLALTGAGVGPLVQVAFTGADDKTLPDVPALTFDEADFSTERGGGIVLNKPIEIPEGGKRYEIAKVWLLDEKGHAGAVCELVNPLPGGGGTTALMSKGSLLFRTPAPSAAEG